jgi:tetratricopeptide (TPR) repeat protein
MLHQAQPPSAAHQQAPQPNISEPSLTSHAAGSAQDKPTQSAALRSQEDENVSKKVPQPASGSSDDYAIKDARGSIHAAVTLDERTVAGLLQYWAGQELSLGNDGKALEYARIALESNEKLFGTMHNDTANAHAYMAEALSKQGKHEQALSHWRQALAIFENLPGTEHGVVNWIRYQLACTLVKQSSYAEALGHLRQVLTIYEKASGSEHPHTKALYSDIGSILRKMGKDQ